MNALYKTFFCCIEFLCRCVLPFDCVVAIVLITRAIFVIIISIIFGYLSRSVLLFFSCVVEGVLSLRLFCLSDVDWSSWLCFHFLEILCWVLSPYVQWELFPPCQISKIFFAEQLYLFSIQCFLTYIFM